MGCVMGLKMFSVWPLRACKLQQMTSVLAEIPALQLSDLYVEFTRVISEPLLCQ